MEQFILEKEELSKEEIQKVKKENNQLKEYAIKISMKVNEALSQEAKKAAKWRATIWDKYYKRKENNPYKATKGKLNYNALQETERQFWYLTSYKWNITRMAWFRFTTKW